MRGYLLLLFTVLLSVGCSKKETCEIPEEISRLPVDLKIDRLEQRFFQIKTVPEMQAFLQQEPLLRDKFLLRDRYPSEELMAQNLLRLATDTSIHKLARQSEERFGNLQDIEQGLENGFKHVKHFYPSFNLPKVQTFISGLSRDLLVSDSLLVLGLDFFIGKEAAYRPQAPEYILKRYEKENLVPSVMLLVSNKFNKTDFVNKEMLDEMIDYGKSYYFTQKVLPCTPDSLIIWYSGQELADVKYNEGKIWAHFIEKGLLYETSQFTIRKYVGERPNVPEISERCPGRVATWVGWQIVRAYMENNPQVTLQQLMEEKDARKILDGSKYKPQKK
ncbi:gliding motility lipoprotein GldB [Rufibacter sp. XAAS-G3-1]|uniref:gliding motility lipoprotein GldB n=1 Tax=Rufibacter sp. XAAS-G3-1 TaxID=2729134 RepID=UPI0021062D25|nr:gliding motility lipoprotein GldB [Rufibacter sp. XAAS-G3-1]